MFNAGHGFRAVDDFKLPAATSGGESNSGVLSSGGMFR
jgi:hypothetical protein